MLDRNNRSVRLWDCVTRQCRTVGRVMKELRCRGAVVRAVMLEAAVFGCCVEGRHVEGHSVWMWCWEQL